MVKHNSGFVLDPDVMHIISIVTIYSYALNSFCEISIWLSKYATVRTRQIAPGDRTLVTTLPLNRPTRCAYIHMNYVCFYLKYFIGKYFILSKLPGR